MLAHHTELFTTIISYKLHCANKGVWHEDRVTNFLRYAYSTSPFKALKYRLFRYTGLLSLMSCSTPIKILVPSTVIMSAHYTELLSAPMWYKLHLPKQRCMRSRPPTSGFVLPHVGAPRLPISVFPSSNFPLSFSYRYIRSIYIHSHLLTWLYKNDALLTRWFPSYWFRLQSQLLSFFQWPYWCIFYYLSLMMLWAYVLYRNILWISSY